MPYQSRPLAQIPKPLGRGGAVYRWFKAGQGKEPAGVLTTLMLPASLTDIWENQRWGKPAL